MNRWLMLSTGLVATALLSATLAYGQQPTPADCAKNTPQTVAGEVVRVDHATNKVTIREKNGTTHEFQANADTAKDMKKGDTIEARLREAPKC